MRKTVGRTKLILTNSFPFAFPPIKYDGRTKRDLSVGSLLSFYLKERWTDEKRFVRRLIAVLYLKERRTDKKRFVRLLFAAVSFYSKMDGRNWVRHAYFSLQERHDGRKPSRPSAHFCLFIKEKRTDETKFVVLISILQERLDGRTKTDSSVISFLSFFSGKDGRTKLGLSCLFFCTQEQHDDRTKLSSSHCWTFFWTFLFWKFSSWTSKYLDFTVLGIKSWTFLSSPYKWTVQPTLFWITRQKHGFERKGPPGIVLQSLFLNFRNCQVWW